MNSGASMMVAIHAATAAVWPVSSRKMIESTMR